MNKKNLILASVLTVIFTSILIIFSPSSKKTSPSIPTPSPISTESISPTPDPTADWKTYENKEYGFSLEIPNYLVTKSHPNFPWQIDFWNESDDTTGYYKYYRNALLNDPENYELPLFWIYIDGNSMKTLQGDGGNGPQELIYIKPINENFGLFSFGVMFSDQVCVTEKNNKTIMIECSDKNLSNPLFTQILSTFKFTDPTADWKTYENKEYGFSFKYPLNLNDLKKKSQNQYYLTSLTSSDLKYTKSPLDPDIVSYGTEYRILFDNEKCNVWSDNFGIYGYGIFNKNTVDSFPANVSYDGPSDNTYRLNVDTDLGCMSLIGEYGQNTIDKSKIEFNQILSTFKFTP